MVDAAPKDLPCWRWRLMPMGTSSFLFIGNDSWHPFMRNFRFVKSDMDARSYICPKPAHDLECRANHERANMLVYRLYSPFDCARALNEHCWLLPFPPRGTRLRLKLHNATLWVHTKRTDNPLNP